MSIETYIQKKKRRKELETGELKPMILSAIEIASEKAYKEMQPIIIEKTNEILNKEIENLVKNVRKGDKGDSVKGDKGDKGDDYILTPQDKKEIASKIKVPIVDKIIEKTEVIKEIDKPIEAEEIIKKINTQEESINQKVIKGLTTEIEAIYKALNSVKTSKKFGAAHGGGFTDSNFIDDETPSGTINGTNKIFTLAYTPNPSTSVKVFVNGARMRITEDYTLSGSTITFTTAPPTTSIILVDYRK